MNTLFGLRFGVTNRLKGNSSVLDFLVAVGAGQKQVLGPVLLDGSMPLDVVHL